MKPIFEYLDYRKFISDFFVDKRERTSFFSFRYAQTKVGMDASNLSKVVQSKRHISEESIENFITLMELDLRESEYFRLLVQFGKCRAQKKSREIFERLMGFSQVEAHQVSYDKYEFYQKWYYSAVLALLFYYPVKKGEWHTISTQLRPPISDRQALESIRLLLKLNFITEDENGYYQHTNSIITSGEQWESIELESFQKQMVDLALQAFETTPVSERNISTLTVTLSEESYQKIRGITAEYRKEVLKAVSESDTTDQVYQINLQMFPLSNRRTHE